MAEHFSSEGRAAILRLREEINRLSVLQTEALKMATFLGMTTAEAEAYDARRVQITRLVRTLAQIIQVEPAAGVSPLNIPSLQLEVRPVEEGEVLEVATPVEPSTTSSPIHISRTSKT